MSKPNFTAWKVADKEDQDIFREEHVNEDSCALKVVDGTHNCSIWVWGADQNTADRAAQLIAAAPAMLAAMLSVLCDPECNPCFKGSDNDREVIRAAIAKARGKV